MFYARRGMIILSHLPLAISYQPSAINYQPTYKRMKIGEIVKERILN
jgi:hypothetical protein